MGKETNYCNVSHNCNPKIRILTTLFHVIETLSLEILRNVCEM